MSLSGRCIAVLGGLLMAVASAQAAPACGAEWPRRIEARLATGDGQGHGPDLGSDEWQSALEARLGLRDTPGLPARHSAAWCRRIEQALERAAPQPPACRARNAEGSIAALVCSDAGMRALDLKMAEVYAAALRKAGREQPPRLKPEQRGWIKGRDDCWKAGEAGRRACVLESYQRRIAELQARYRLLPVRASVRYVCNPQQPADELQASFFETDPPSLIAERGDQVSLMFLQPQGPGRRYEGRNESLQDEGEQVLLRWGYQAPELRCTRAP